MGSSLTRRASQIASRAVSLLCMTALCMTAALTGCDPPPAATSTPAHGNVRSLDVFVADGRVHRLIGTAVRDPQHERPQHLRLWHDHSDDGGQSWSPRVDIAAGHPIPPRATSRGEDAQIAAHGDALLAVWAGRGAGVWGSGPLGSAVSHDGGQTWNPAPQPADDETPQPDAAPRGVRFPALHASAQGLDLVWINAIGDGRSVHYARAPSPGSPWSAPVTLDADSCACCWNAVTTGFNGQPVALYRDEDPRDMHARSRHADGTWNPAVQVGAFNWAFNGCPHVGAGLAYDPQAQRLHAVVWTGNGADTGLYALHQDPGPSQWSLPQRLGTAHATHPDLVLAGPNHLVAAWSDTGPQGPELRWSASRDGGMRWSTPQRIATHGPGTPDHPRLTFSGSVITAHWTQGGGQAPTTARSAILSR